MDTDLRDAYQRRTIDTIQGLVAQGLDVFVEAPTGTGKTRMVLDALAPDRDRGLRTLIVQHRDVLMEQNAQRARERGYDVRLMSDADPTSGNAVVGVADTIALRPEAVGRIDRLWIDETHHATADSRFGRMIDALVALNPDMRIVASSATPQRADDRELHPRVAAAGTALVSWNEGMASGMVLPPDTKVGTIRLRDGSTLQDHARGMIDPDKPGQSAIGLNGVFKRLKPVDFIDQCVSATLRQKSLAGARTLFFMDGIADAERLEAAFAEAGRSVLTIHSRQPPAERRRRIEAYRSGEVQGLASVDMIGEGFDVPETQAIVCCKVTTSAVEHVQMLGRLTRASDGKGRGQLLDLGASTLMHGSLEVMAGVQAHVRGLPSRAANDQGNRWRAWTPCGRSGDTVGIDLGRRAVFATRIGRDEFLMTEVDRIGADKTVIKPIGIRDAKACREYGRQAIAANRKTVITLCSDVDDAGTSAMARRLEGLMSRHGGAVTRIAATHRERSDAARPRSQARSR